MAVNQAPGSGRARRDAAARAMQGWHAHRLLGSGEVADPIIKVHEVSLICIYTLSVVSYGLPFPL